MTRILIQIYLPTVMLLNVLLPATTARAQASATSSPVVDVKLREWQIPWRINSNGAPWIDGKGRVWIAGETENYLAVFDTVTKSFRQLTLPMELHPQSIAGDDSALYVFGAAQNVIVKVALKSDSMTTIRIPGSTTVGPHSVLIDQRARALWFTSAVTGTIARFDVASHGFLSWNLSGTPQPRAVALDGQGHPWFSLSGSAKLSRIDPDRRSSHPIALATDGEPWRLATGADGSIWYTDHRRGKIGNVDTRTETVTEFDVPGGGLSKPSSLVVDARGIVWVAQDGPAANNIFAFDTTRQLWIGAIVVGRVNSIGITDLLYDLASNSIWYVRTGGMLGQIALHRSAPNL